MTPNRPPAPPPVPRDHDEVTFSEMVPFRSRNISLFRSPLTLFMLASALIATLLFGIGQNALNNPDPNIQMQAFQALTVFSVFLLLLMMQVGVFFYARPGRSIFAYFIAYFAVCVILTTPLVKPYFFVFRTLLPGGNINLDESSFPRAFINMFFGAGLCEELIKATPTLLFAWVAITTRNHPERSNAWNRFVAVRGPLDGVVMGVFAGAGFILLETALQYVPDTANAVYRQTNNIGLGFAGGLMLLLPRVLGGMVGHMAYSAIFGYFIGLGVIRPRKFVQLVLGGWLASALIHALWNSVMIISPLLMYAVAIVAGIFAAGALLKARHLQQRLFGDAPDSFGSVVIDRRPLAPPPVMAPPPLAYPPAPPPPPPAAEGPLSLDVAGLVMPLRADTDLVFADEPALGGVGAGVRGAVVPHPSRPGVLGLRNAGVGGWTATLRDGQVQRIERDQNIRLAAGVSIDFGDGLIGRVVAAG